LRFKFCQFVIIVGEAGEQRKIVFDIVSCAEGVFGKQNRKLGRNSEMRT
jgi:hypothetical protein